LSSGLVSTHFFVVGACPRLASPNAGSGYSLQLLNSLPQSSSLFAGFPLLSLTQVESKNKIQIAKIKKQITKSISITNSKDFNINGHNFQLPTPNFSPKSTHKKRQIEKLLKINE
jgi:hypothetical protein